MRGNTTLTPSPSRRRGSSDFAGHPQADRSAPPALDSRLHGNDDSKFAGVSYVSHPLAKERHPREGTSSSRRNVIPAKAGTGTGPSVFAGHSQADRSAPPALDSRLHGKDGRKLTGVSHSGTGASDFAGHCLPERPYLSPNDSDRVFRSGFSKKSSTVRSPVRISTWAVMPGNISSSRPVVVVTGLVWVKTCTR